MEKTHRFKFLKVFVGLIILGWVGPVGAVPTFTMAVTIDITSLAGKDISLDFSLYDNSGVLWDSWGLIDNVALEGGIPIDFEDGTLGGFDDSLNPASVNVVAGSLFGGGSKLLRLDEDPGVTPTITYKDYVNPGVNSLSFELEMTASETVGVPFGLDELVVTVYDLSGSNQHILDALVVNANGVIASQETSYAFIPVPGAGILAMIGISFIGFFRRQYCRK